MRFYTNVQLIGNQFLVRGVDNGRRFEIRDKEFSPTLFVKSKVDTKYKTLNGDSVDAIQPGSVRDCREFYKTYDEIDGFEIYGNDRYIYQYISEKYPEDEIKFDISQIKLVTLDIETTAERGFPDVESASEEILAITIQDYTTKEIITWGVKPFVNKQKNVTYHHCHTEHELLSNFINHWMQDVPDVVTGWNIQLFDIPYICKRLDRVLGEKLMKRFSNWGLVTEGKIFIQGREHITFDVGGLTQLDYLDLYKKFTYKAQESYRLDYIAEVELGQKKLDHSEFDTFKDFYTHGWQKFIEYNIVDVELVDRLEDKMKLIELAIVMAYDAKANYADVFSQVRMWDTIIYNHLRSKNIVPPAIQESKTSKGYEGAYVKDPVVGFHDWICSFDLNSLYPHLIMQYNISPETMVNHNPNTCSVEKFLSQEADLSDLKSCTITPNGAMFNTLKRGFLPELMDKLYKERVIYKKKMIEAKKLYQETGDKRLQNDIAANHNIQLARKIALNSAYGAIGNQYFRYFDVRHAEGITKAGQLAIRWIERDVNKYLNDLMKTKNVSYVVASDTDSIYVKLGAVVDKIFKDKSDIRKIVKVLDKFCEEKLQKEIDRSYDKLAKYTNAYENKMVMKREVIANKGIWTAKKRYILNVYNEEGVDMKEPKLKIMGIEAVKSSTPAPCRVKIKEALKVIMNKDENALIEFIDEFRNHFRKLRPEQIAYPRSCNNLKKYSSSTDIYQKSTPIHVKGALLYNNLLKKNKLVKYEEIQEGDKIKFVVLKEPNPIREKVISFPARLPKEFNLHDFIDYDEQFDKSFLEPLRFIVNAINWSFEKQATLDNFF